MRNMQRMLHKQPARSSRIQDSKTVKSVQRLTNLELFRE